MSTSRGFNKLGSKTLVPLIELIESLLSREGLTCLGIMGEGGSFAVGADLREIRELIPESARRFSDLGNSLFRLLETTDTIVVAGIDGFCLGGGLDLALSADWRISSKRSVFGHPGADLGLITGFGGTQRMPRLMGKSKTVEMIYKAERIDAHTAYNSGLLQELCTVERFEESMYERLDFFASRPAEVLREIKCRFREPVIGNR